MSEQENVEQALMIISNDKRPDRDEALKEATQRAVDNGEDLDEIDDWDDRIEMELEFQDENEWEQITENINEALRLLSDAPTRWWRAEGRNMGWQHRSGYKVFKADKSREFLSELLPNTANTFRFEVFPDRLEVKNYHHDSPCGEFYTVYPAYPCRECGGEIGLGKDFMCGDCQWQVTHEALADKLEDDAWFAARERGHDMCSWHTDTYVMNMTIERSCHCRECGYVADISTSSEAFSGAATEKDCYRKKTKEVKNG